MERCHLDAANEACVAQLFEAYKKPSFASQPNEPIVSGGVKQQARNLFDPFSVMKKDRRKRSGR